MSERPSERPGVLLVNLGSPDSTSVADVRRYLGEFLMDERVIDIPYLWRWLLVKGLILPTRPRKSAQAYEKIWQPTGSPLIHISRQLADHVQMRTEAPVALGMRYGNPGVREALESLRHKEISEIRMIPLYPHYAMSSYETVVLKVQQELKALKWNIPLKVLPPFFQDPDYIQALVDSAREYLAQDYDKILFSYHGLPERHMQKTDPSGEHCLKVADCCHCEHPAHQYCYRHQVFATTEAFVAQAGIPQDKVMITFQSRLGRTPWLKPYTDLELLKLSQEGVKKILVICPAFVSDCLETLEEIAIRAKADFKAAGGEELVAIPCMNTHPTWVQTLANWIHDDSAFLPPIKGERILSMASA